MRCEEQVSNVYFCFLFCSREFTHRVKSVSMSKFTLKEVEALQKGGNQVTKHARFCCILILLSDEVINLLLQRAREIFLKDWDLQRMMLPDNRSDKRTLCCLISNNDRATINFVFSFQQYRKD